MLDHVPRVEDALEHFGQHALAHLRGAEHAAVGGEERLGLGLGMGLGLRVVGTATATATTTAAAATTIAAATTAAATITSVVVDAEMCRHGCSGESLRVVEHAQSALRVRLLRAIASLWGEGGEMGEGKGGTGKGEGKGAKGVECQ